LSGVDTVSAQLGRAAQVDAALKPALDMVESASVNLREAVHHLRQYLERVEVDPARLAEADRKMGAIHDMARKYRVDPSRIGELVVQKQARLGALGGENSLDELRAREAKAEGEYTQSAQKLSKLRAKGAKKFAADVTTAMQTLAMEGGRLDVVLTACEPAAYGLEQCEYLVAAHEGQPSGPLARIASGGELSRISLAIQVLASTRAGVPTLIFDEVDSGIGGRVAEIVGRLLKQLATSRQVMCVTHLPQVAACADQQLRVAKEPAENGVVSRIDALKGAARVEEIARMLGGIQITAATRKHAEEMLKNARSQPAAVGT
jgi:DNA repair protein RecN (Recombination protein N)